MLPPKVLKYDNVFFRKDAPLSVREALNVLARIEARDPKALDDLTCGDAIGMMVLKEYRAKPEAMFANEWGAAKESGVLNPQCVIVAGDKGSVTWDTILDAGLIPLSHSHPFFRKESSATRAIAENGVLWDDINGVNPKQDLAARLRVFPSRGDVQFCAENNLAVHVVKTPYCIVYGGNNNNNASGPRIPWVMNPDCLGKNRVYDPLSFRLFDVREVEPKVYKTCLVAVFGERDAWRKHDIRVEIPMPFYTTDTLKF